MKIVATIEARMTSSRLPGKTLLPAAGISMLEHLVRRLKAVPSIDAIVLATTVNAADAPLVDLAERLGIAAFRGDEDDVMQRVIDAAASAQADVVVEITGDCPIIDPEIVEQTIRMFKAHRADYVSNALVRSYPDGMDTQVFRLETLRKSAAMTNEPLDREHVTLHIRNHPELFSHVHLVAPPEIHWPELGLTLDERSDYDLLKKIIEHFDAQGNALFSCLDAVRLLRQFPEFAEINKDVVRKGNT
ncbi:cytidylyltransferase domain-containing protein [Herbaspirillum seropedicae]|uniref:cytidylyltransferase domain-containing protein n=1 Tax=Herbaspirillum seropedicae TaxID=964 RepID=UPI003F8CF91D